MVSLTLILNIFIASNVVYRAGENLPSDPKANEKWIEKA